MSETPGQVLKRLIRNMGAVYPYSASVHEELATAFLAEMDLMVCEHWSWEGTGRPGEWKCEGCGKVEVRA